MYENFFFRLLQVRFKDHNTRYRKCDHAQKYKTTEERGKVSVFR